MYEFPHPAPVNVVARLGAGALDLIAEPRDTATVQVFPAHNNDQSRSLVERTTIELAGDTLTIDAAHASSGLFRRGGVRIEIRVPADSAIQIKSASADVTCRGRLATAAVETASGDVELDHVSGDAVLRTSSGDIRAERVDGGLTLSGASGDLTAGYAGGPVFAKGASSDVVIQQAAAGARVHTTSGDVHIGAANGDSVEISTSSGDVRIGATGGGSVEIGTTSGDIGVGVTPGTGVWLDLSTRSGSTRNGLEMGTSAPPNGHQLSLALRTTSGDINVHRATPAAKTL